MTVVLNRWWSFGVQGKRGTRAIEGFWGQSSQWGTGVKPSQGVRGAKPPEAGGILISDAKNEIKTDKINSNKSQMETIHARLPEINIA